MKIDIYKLTALWKLFISDKFILIEQRATKNGQSTGQVHFYNITKQCFNRMVERAKESYFKLYFDKTLPIRIKKLLYFKEER